jgi:hypothetical protein
MLWTAPSTGARAVLMMAALKQQFREVPTSVSLMLLSAASLHRLQVEGLTIVDCRQQHKKGP